MERDSISGGLVFSRQEVEKIKMLTLQVHIPAVAPQDSCSFTMVGAVLTSTSVSRWTISVTVDSVTTLRDPSPVSVMED